MIDTDTVEIVNDEPTDEQLEKAFKLACAEFGDCVADYEGEEFKREFHNQLKRILDDEAIAGLIDKGLITAMVRDDGHIGYLVTEAGRQVVETIGIE